jgi:hypothetical protein
MDGIFIKIYICIGANSMSIAYLPPLELKPFVNEIYKALIAQDSSHAKEWGTLLSCKGSFGDALRNILEIAGKFPNNTQPIIEIISNSLEETSAIIFNLVKLILENKSSSIEADTLKSKLQILHRIDSQKSGLTIAHFTTLNSMIDIKEDPHLAKLISGNLPTPTIPRYTLTHSSASSPLQPPSGKNNSESIPSPKRQRGRPRKIADSGDVQPLQISVEMSASKSTMFRETREAKRKRETEIIADATPAPRHSARLPTPAKMWQ